MSELNYNLKKQATKQILHKFKRKETVHHLFGVREHSTKDEDKRITKREDTIPRRALEKW